MLTITLQVSRGAAALLLAWQLLGNAADAKTIVVAAGQSINAALKKARSGDLVLLKPGTYRESVTLKLPALQLVAEKPGSVQIAFRGTALTVMAPNALIAGIIFDGQWGEYDVIKLKDKAHFTVLDTIEVRNSSRDGIDMPTLKGVVVRNALIHHLLWFNPQGTVTNSGATIYYNDCHGIAYGGTATGYPADDPGTLTVENCTIHTFSGDAIQADPNRNKRPWQLSVSNCSFYSRVLQTAQEANGFPLGSRPGENAIDTKTSAVASKRSLVSLHNCTARGFGRSGAMLPNAAAWNLKEGVDAVVANLVTFDCDIAFRVRFYDPQGLTHFDGRNLLVFDCHRAFRLDHASEPGSSIDRFRLANATIGLNVDLPFAHYGSLNAGPFEFDYPYQAYNVLAMGRAFTGVLWHPSNLVVEPEDADQYFVNANADDYRLRPGAPAIDAGAPMPWVDRDLLGVRRPQGNGWDVGAYEYVP
jgi:hypothetical protein